MLIYRFVPIVWADIRVGDIVKVLNNEPIPVREFIWRHACIYMYTDTNILFMHTKMQIITLIHAFYTHLNEATSSYTYDFKESSH